MSDTISSLRRSIADIIADTGITATAYMPERISPPMVIVEPAEDFVTPANQFGFHVIRHQITVMVTPGDNLKEVDDLCDKVETILIAIRDDTDIETVSQPYLMTANNGSYLAANINVSNTVRLEN